MHKPFTNLSSQQIGKRFERDLEAAFRDMQRTHGFKFHRFTDTREAGNVVREQPADYLITTPVGLALVEAKASATLTHFRPSLLRPSQKGAIRHFAQMLGIPFFVLFRSDTDERVDLLDGKLCLTMEDRKPVPPIASVRNYPLSAFLAEQWRLRPINAVVRNFNLRYGEVA